ncbi:F-box protein [Phanerochaete sordida]|uniref:F-box protein n=1 Tax=Phanerochaete sordida TaxID=48140 RepID=A0A9P3LHB0_9APHY|nr:F-box protein [Phanerochaete sordida]
MPTLPLELIELIIDQLSANRGDLRSCSLVSRSWLPRSSKHLFRSLCVSRGRRETLHVLCSLVLSSERMATNIYSLSITIDRSTANKAAPLLGHLPALHTLDISATLDLERCACPDATAQPGRHIEDLNLSSMPIDVVAYFLGLFSSVGTLAVRRCWQEGTVPRAHRVRCLGVIQLDGPALRDMSRLVEPSTLQGIFFHFPPESPCLLPEDVAHFFRVLGAHIQTLVYFVDPLCEEPVLDRQALQSCEALESFEVLLPHEPAFHDDCWRSMLVALSALPPHTRNVRLVSSRESTQGASNALQSSDWKAVGCALEHCSALERLQIKTPEPSSMSTACADEGDLQSIILISLSERLRGITIFE